MKEEITKYFDNRLPSNEFNIKIYFNKYNKQTEIIEINLENEVKLSIILIYSDGYLYYDFMDKINICPLANGDLIYINTSDCINKINEILKIFYFDN